MRLGRARPGLVAAALVAGGWATALTMGEGLPWINSDQLYLPHLLQDLASGGRLRDWIVQPSPSLLPDLVFMALARSLASDLGHAFVACALLSYLWLVAAAAFCARALGQPAWRGALAAAAYAVALRAYPLARGIFVTPAHHGANLAAALFLLGLAARPGRARLAALALAAAGGVSSDPLLVAQAVAPLALALLLARAPARAAALAAGALAGWLLLGQLEPLVPRPAFSHPLLDPGEIGRFLEDLGRQTAQAPLFAGWLLLLLVWAVRQPRLAAIFGALAVPATLASTLLIARWDGSGQRYLQPLYAYPPALLVAAADLPRRAALAAGAVLLALFVWSGGTRGLAVPSFGLPRLDFMACIDRFAEEQGIRDGYGAYWRARRLTFYSRVGLRVLAVDPAGAPYYWLNTRREYRQVAGAVPARVLVVDNELAEGEVLARFGPPGERAVCGDWRLSVRSLTPARWRRAGLSDGQP